MPAIKQPADQHFEKLFSEIAFPPFGLTMSIDHPPVHRDLCELTHLNLYKYRAWDELPV